MPDIDKLHSRVAAVEETQKEHHARLEALRMDNKLHAEALAENTKLTKQVVDNTGELVELFKGAKAFRKFMLWAATICAPLYAAYEFIFKGLMK